MNKPRKSEGNDRIQIRHQSWCKLPSPIFDALSDLGLPIFNSTIQKLKRTHNVVQVQRLSDSAIVPKKESEGSARYNIFDNQDVVIPSNGRRAKIHMGIAIACPRGTRMRIAPRSEITLRNGIDIGAGVVNSDFRGELCVLLFNFDKEKDFVVKKGDQISQMILTLTGLSVLNESDSLSYTV